jgi:hypothetical protein
VSDNEVQERDKEVFEAILRAYNFELDQKDRLNEKLQNIISLVGTIATLNLGVGFFILDKITSDNLYYLHLIVLLLLGIISFAAAILTSLFTYKPTKYYVYLADPKRFIKKYSNLTKTHVVRESAMAMADVVELNRKVNLWKVGKLSLIFCFIVLGIVALVLFTIFTVLALGIPPIDP